MIIAKQLGFANGVPSSVHGQYLRSFDFEANDGLGFAEFTDEIAEAMRFDDLGAFHAFYVRIPECRPLRDDGKLNRPMTASHWEAVQVPE